MTSRTTRKMEGFRMPAVAAERVFRLRSVLLATDFSDASEAALPDLVEAWRNAEDLETRLLEAGLLAGLQHELLVQQGTPWDVLDDIIRQRAIDLVVSGAHGRRGVRKVLLGSIAEQIFRNADCPVFTAGPESHLQDRITAKGTVRLFGGENLKATQVLARKSPA